MITKDRGDCLIIDDPLLKVWIETALEPIWFGFWHRKVYIVRTDFMKMTFRYRDEAEEFAGLMRWHLTPH